jgi:hypothetical protein
MNEKIAPRGILGARERQVIDFVEGHSDGAELMLAIYGDIADDAALPPRLAALLERWRKAEALRR